MADSGANIGGMSVQQLSEQLKLLEKQAKVQSELLRIAEENLEIAENNKTVTEEITAAVENAVKELKKTNTELEGVQKVYNEIEGDITSTEKSLGSLTGINRTFLGLERQRLALQKDLAKITGDFGTKTIGIKSTIQSIAELSGEEVTKRDHLIKQAKQELDSMDTTNDVQRQIKANLQEQLKNAEKLSSLSTQQQTFLNNQLEVYDKIRDTINMVLGTVKLLTSNAGQLFGGALIGAGFLVDKVGELNKSFGTTMSNMNSFVASAAGLKILGFEQAETVAKGLANELGSTEKATAGLQMNANLLASNLGLSGDEASKLIGQFGQLSGQTSDQALNMISSTRAAAQMAGVLPNDVMKDIAGNSEFIAQNTKGTGENIAKAAIQARQLGLTLQNTAAITDSLLDFETSISKELEASAMLGRDINFQKARELMYMGDQAGAMKEILGQLGSVEEFNQMDYYQKKAVAETLGISVAELQKMYANQENLNTASGKLGQQYSTIAEASNYIANEWGGGILKGLGGAIMMASTFGKEVSNVRDRMKDASSFGEKFKSFFGFGKATPSPTITSDASKQLTGNLPKQDMGGGGGTPTDQAGQLSKATKAFPSATQLLSLAVVLIAFAAAIYILAKAFQEFDKIQNVIPVIVMFGVAIAGMIGVLFAIGTMTEALQPILWPLVGVLLAIGGAMTLMGLGVKLASEGLATLVTSFQGLGEGAAMNMLAFAASIGILSASLLSLATAGILASPALAALTAFTALGGGKLITELVSGGGEGGAGAGGEKTTLKSVVDAVNALKTELMGKQLVVQLDGRTIYENVALQNRKTPVTITR